MRFPNSGVLSFLISLAMVSTGWAVMPLPTVFTDEVTVTATGSEEPAADVPVPVTVISREEIDDSQEESVADLLRRSPGLAVLRAGDEGAHWRG